METYYEYRAPSGTPADGERNVWFADGKVKWGKWDAATSAWVIEREEDYQGQVGMQGPTGEAGPPCPTGGEADTLDGYHASDFLTGEDDTWHKVGAAGEPAYGVAHSAMGSGTYDNLWFRKKNGVVYIQGACKFIYQAGYDEIFTLPVGYRPSQDVIGVGSVYQQNYLTIGSGYLRIYSNGEVKYYGFSRGESGTCEMVNVTGSFPV